MRQPSLVVAASLLAGCAAAAPPRRLDPPDLLLEVEAVAVLPR
jgi:hypothetical protein